MIKPRAGFEHNNGVNKGVVMYLSFCHPACQEYSLKKHFATEIESKKIGTTSIRICDDLIIIIS